MFGIQLKGVIVGILLVLFVWPFISRMIAGVGSKA